MPQQYSMLDVVMPHVLAPPVPRELNFRPGIVTGVADPVVVPFPSSP